MHAALKRFLMPWTALVVSAAPLLLLLCALPESFAATRSFTLLLIATYALVCWRIYLKNASRLPSKIGLLLAPLLLVFFLVDALAFVHLKLPFWRMGDSGLAAKSLDVVPPEHEIFLVEHGWHTGLVLKTSDLVASGAAVFSPMSRHQYLEVGWGDAEFYRADEPTFAMAIGAMLTPGPAVLYLSEFDEAAPVRYPNERVHRLTVDEQGMRAIARFVAASFETGPDGAERFVGHGFDGPTSRFVAAKGSYYFPNTCNVWTAEALAAAGVPMMPPLAVTSRALIHQARLASAP